MSPEITLRRQGSKSSIQQELLRLISNPSDTQQIAMSLYSRHPGDPSFISTLLNTIFQTLQQLAKEKGVMEAVDNRDVGEDAEVTFPHITTSEGNSAALPVRYLEFRNYIQIFADLVMEITNLSKINGQLDNDIIELLNQGCDLFTDHPATQLIKDAVTGPPRHHGFGNWLFMFVSALVARKVLRLDVLLVRFINPTLDLIAKRLVQLQQDQHEAISNTNKEQLLMQLCNNISIMVRSLIVQDTNIVKPQSAGRRRQSTSDMDEQQSTGTHTWKEPQTWIMRLDELMSLQTLRKTYLASTMQGLMEVFHLLHGFAQVASQLALSSPLLHDLTILRSDILSLSWFKCAFLRDMGIIYDHIAEEPTNGATSDENGMSDTTTDQTYRSRILSILNELICATSSQNFNQGSPNNVNTATSNIIDKFKDILSNINQWNFERSRVQLCLLLDAKVKPRFSRTDSTSSDVNMNMAASLANSVDQGFDSNQHDNEWSDEDLKAFVRFFFDQAILMNEQDVEQRASGGLQEDQDIKMYHEVALRKTRFLKNLVQSIRNELVEALLNHGVEILAGPTTATEAMSSNFLECILLCSICDSQAPDFASKRHDCRAKAFFEIMQVLIAENVWDNTHKIDFLRTSLGQIKRFTEPSNIYNVMHSCDVSYVDAARALQICSNSTVSHCSLFTLSLQ
jgi:hypothetical protein